MAVFLLNFLVVNHAKSEQLTNDTVALLFDLSTGISNLSQEVTSHGNTHQGVEREEKSVVDVLLCDVILKLVNQLFDVTETPLRNVNQQEHI